MVTSPIHLVLASAAIGGAVGCTAVTVFDPAALAEGSDQSCADGIDNDGDSLMDCQDFDCLEQRVCCDRAAVILEDDFASTAECGVPDAARWHTWGAPLPVLCDGGLWPRKADACYDVGVVSSEAFALRSGLTVVAGIAGMPETKGRLEIGLTFQETVTGSVDSCAPIPAALPFLSLAQVATSGGYRLVARFDEHDLASSSTITDAARHELSLRIDDAGRVHYAVDGVEFAVSPVGQPVTSVSRPAHLVLAGRGMVAHFTDVQLIAGTQCDIADGWEPAAELVALAMDVERDLAWDAYEVTTPLVVVDQADPELLHMYYTGCNEPTVGHRCDIGHATSAGGDPFVRDPVNPVGDRGAPWVMGTAEAFNGPSGDYLNLNGQPGDWDELVIAVGAIENGDDVEIWYAGWRPDEGVKRIGLARSADGGATFTKHPSNPVLREGVFGDFDDRGLDQPFVLFDAQRGLYRMWYIAEGFLGASNSLGYAVSGDGVNWVKHEQPVLVPEQLGLLSFGKPSVLPGDQGLRLWLHGRWADDPAHQIIELVNRGLRHDEL